MTSEELSSLKAEIIKDVVANLSVDVHVRYMEQYSENNTQIVRVFLKYGDQVISCSEDSIYIDC